MTDHGARPSRNWFTSGGERYATFRPHYPTQLSEFLVSLAQPQSLVVDVGCGTGQLTTQLADHVERVVGVDPSLQQLKHAVQQHNIDYIQAQAEGLPLSDNQAGLIVAAQAAHWFDLPRFYTEVRRVGLPGAIVALVSYGVLQLDPDLQDRFDTFYWQEIGPYWPAARKLVDRGYADLAFPFEPIEPPHLMIQQSWTLEQFLGYVSTWSALTQAREAGKEDLLVRFAQDLERLWGEPTTIRTVTWPIHMRLGRR